jgi:multisubunit Na+/H+ antiporter MnhC subunit
LLEGERYTARMFSLPLLILIVMAVLPVDRWLREATTHAWHRRLALVALLFLVIDTAASMRLWRVAVSSGMFGPTTFDVAATAVAHRADPAYTTALVIGVATTAATALALAVLAARERYRDQPAARRQSA